MSRTIGTPGRRNAAVTAAEERRPPPSTTWSLTVSSDSTREREGGVEIENVRIELS